MKFTDQPAPANSSYYVPSKQKEDLERAGPIVSSSSPKRRRGWYFVVPVAVCAVILGAVMAIVLREKAKTSSRSIAFRSVPILEPPRPRQRFSHTIVELNAATHNSTTNSPQTLASRSESAHKYTAADSDAVSYPHSSANSAKKAVIFSTQADASAFTSVPLPECKGIPWGKAYFDCYCKILTQTEICRLNKSEFLIVPDKMLWTPLSTERQPRLPMTLRRRGGDSNPVGRFVKDHSDKIEARQGAADKDGADFSVKDPTHSGKGLQSRRGNSDSDSFVEDSEIEQSTGQTLGPRGGDHHPTWFVKAVADSIEDSENEGLANRRIFFLERFGDSSTAKEAEIEVFVLRQLVSRDLSGRGLNTTDSSPVFLVPTELSRNNETSGSRGSDWKMVV